MLERGIVSVTGELKIDQPLRFYHLADLAAGQTFYAFADALTGDLKPVLTLYDYSDKAVAYGNFSATDSRAALQYELPRRAEHYRLRISSQDPAGKTTAGNFRLLMGLNAPEVLLGDGEPTGRQLLREPIPVGIGVKLQQITQVDQKAENYGVVATLVLHWHDPALAFDPEVVRDRFKVFTGDSFATEMSRRGQLWPQYTLVNQQGNRWVQNRVVVIQPDGETVYLERFSTTLQAPDFDFRDFPFDVQRFFIRIDLLAPEWLFLLREIEGYSAVGDKLGEEEWVVTDLATEFSRGEMLQRPVSRFNFAFSAKRHVDYYVFRILLPLTVIIAGRRYLQTRRDHRARLWSLRIPTALLRAGRPHLPGHDAPVRRGRAHSCPWVNGRLEGGHAGGAGANGRRPSRQGRPRRRGLRPCQGPGRRARNRAGPIRSRTPRSMDRVPAHETPGHEDTVRV